MKRQGWTHLAVFGLMSISATAGCGQNEMTVERQTAELSTEGPAVEFDTRRLTIRSEPFVIEKQFGSMQGPSQTYPVALEADSKDIVWLQAVRNRALSDHDESLSEEFLCHSNLALAGSREQMQRTNDLFRATPSTDPRIFTLVQGRNDIVLPPGYAFPVAAGEPLRFDSMVINKNWTDLPLDVVVETTIDYALGSELDTNPRALFKRRLFTYLEVEKDDHTPDHTAHQHSGSASTAAGSSHHYPGAGLSDTGEGLAQQASGLVGHDQKGREYTFHWFIDPGRHEFTSDVSSQLALPFKTTLNYATAHLHPYGESVRIVDRTTGEKVIELAARQYSDDRIGIAEMEQYSNSEGITFDPEHRYELVTTYNNTTDKPIDAMAILYLYFRDRGFRLVDSG